MSRGSRKTARAFLCWAAAFAISATFRSACSAEPMDNCWRKVWSLTPPCTELNDGDGNGRLCISNSKCANTSRPNTCTIEFISSDENYPIRSMSISDGPELTQKPRRSTNAEAWIGGLLSVGVISLSGLVGGIFWPLLNDPNKKKSVMRLLLGLATGSLSSSAVFQLLPEAFKIQEAFPDFKYTALIMWLSLCGLYTIETLAGIFFYKEEKKISVDELSPSLQLANGNTTEMKQISHGHSHKMNTKSNDDKSPISTLALLVLFGDGLHNMIDGMSIGAAFSENITTGISISIAIACEEFPHEIGDFAILIQSGMSFRRAMCFNFLSACTAFIGFIIGICLGNMEYSGFVFSFAGGLFLFITLTHLTPEMKNMVDENLTESKTSAYIGLLLQNIGMFTGATLMYIITFSGSINIQCWLKEKTYAIQIKNNDPNIYRSKIHVYIIWTIQWCIYKVKFNISFTAAIVPLLQYLKHYTKNKNQYGSEECTTKLSKITR